MTRRLVRRLQLRRSSSLDEYIDLLDKDAQEPELLAKDLLIGVTEFFRDPEAFEHLAVHVLPYIFAPESADKGVRVWVPGCASGEEAYSLGILVQQRLAGLRPAPPVLIFATDIDADAIAEARQARYPANIADHVSPERLARFFTQDGSSYVVAKRVREMCVFSQLPRVDQGCRGDRLARGEVPDERWPGARRLADRHEARRQPGASGRRGRHGTRRH